MLPRSIGRAPTNARAGELKNGSRRSENHRSKPIFNVALRFYPGKSASALGIFKEVWGSMHGAAGKALACQGWTKLPLSFP
jgi:hypothetical protein